jgi:hypothetical protein
VRIAVCGIALVQSNSSLLPFTYNAIWVESEVFFMLRKDISTHSYNHESESNFNQVECMQQQCRLIIYTKPLLI